MSIFLINSALSFIFNSKKPSDLSDGPSDIPSKTAYTTHLSFQFFVNTTIQVKPSTD